MKALPKRPGSSLWGSTSAKKPLSKKTAVVASHLKKKAAASKGSGASSGGNPTSTKTATSTVANPHTQTSTVANPHTQTSTVANPTHNVTVTGGAGDGATIVYITPGKPPLHTSPEQSAGGGLTKARR